MSSKTTPSKTGLNRGGSDKYYTKDSVVQECLQALFNVYPHFDTIIDPSAGAGAFLFAIPKYYPNCTIEGYDIEPDATGIIKKDFLSLNQDLDQIS